MNKGRKGIAADGASMLTRCGGQETLSCSGKGMDVCISGGGLLQEKAPGHSITCRPLTARLPDSCCVRSLGLEFGKQRGQRQTAGKRGQMGVSCPFGSETP